MADGHAAIALTRAFVPDVLVTDLVLAGADGLAVAAALRASHPSLPVVVTSAAAARPRELARIGIHVAAVVDKERPLAELLDLVVELGRPAVAVAA